MRLSDWLAAFKPDHGLEQAKSHVQLSGLRLPRTFSRVLSASVLLLSTGFLLVILWKGASTLGYDDLRVFWRAGLLAFLLYPFSLLIQALAWSAIVARLGNGFWGWKDIEVYAYTHLMRRLPGSIWYLVGRIAMYQQYGVSETTTLFASAIEWLLLVATALLIFSGYVLFGGMPRSSRVVVALLAASFAGLALLVLVRFRKTGYLPRFLSPWSTGAWPHGIRGHVLISWSALYFFAWLIGGAILFLIARAGGSVSLSSFTAVGIWALVGGTSLLVVIVPVGLGVREITLTLMLQPYLPIPKAALVAVVMRVVFLAGDLVWGCLFWWTARILGKAERQPGDA